MGKIDAAYRRLFQHQEILRDLMACVLSPGLFAALDWARMRPVPTNHVGDRLQQRAGDCAWLIPWITKPPQASAPGLCVLLLRLARSRDVEQWRDLLHTLMDEVRGSDHEELNRSLTAWLQYVARGDDSPTRQLPPVNSLQELDMMIAEKPGIWAQHWRQEGQAEGRVEGQADLLLRQLQRRFGPVPEEIKQCVRAAKTEQLETWSLNYPGRRHTG